MELQKSIFIKKFQFKTHKINKLRRFYLSTLVYIQFTSKMFLFCGAKYLQYVFVLKIMRSAVEFLITHYFTSNRCLSSFSSSAYLTFSVMCSFAKNACNEMLKKAKQCWLRLVILQAVVVLLPIPGAGPRLHLLQAGRQWNASVLGAAAIPPQRHRVQWHGSALQQQLPHQQQLRQLEPVLHRVQKPGQQSLSGRNLLWQYWTCLGRHFSCEWWKNLRPRIHLHFCVLLLINRWLV